MVSSLQELINIKIIDNSKFKIEFNNLISDIYNNKNNYKTFLQNEPDWKTLKPQEISLIVSNFLYLSRLTNNILKRYSWMYNEKFILKEPYFAANAKGMLKLILLQESPNEYKNNNIYVSKNVLTKI